MQYRTHQYVHGAKYSIGICHTCSRVSVCMQSTVPLLYIMQCPYLCCACMQYHLFVIFNGLFVYFLYFTTFQFLGLVMERSGFQVDMPAHVYLTHHVYSFNSTLQLTILPIMMFVTVGLFLVLYLHHSWGAVGTVLAQSQVARHTMRSTMLASWVLLPWAMVHFYIAIKSLAEAVQKKRPFTLFPDVYSPQVTAGYAQLGSFLAILLLEAPCLGVFFLRKATDLHNRRQQLSKSDCRLCYWFTVLCDTLGGTSVVAAVQIGSVYFFYCAQYLTVKYVVRHVHLKGSSKDWHLFFWGLSALASTATYLCH